MTPTEALDRIAALHYRQTLVLENGGRYEHDTCAECGGPDDLWPCDTAKVLAEAVRPVAGVALSPEETALVLDWYRGTEAVTTTADAALAARLEATQ